MRFEEPSDFRRPGSHAVSASGFAICANLVENANFHSTGQLFTRHYGLPYCLATLGSRSTARIEVEWVARTSYVHHALPNEGSISGSNCNILTCAASPCRLHTMELAEFTTLVKRPDTVENEGYMVPPVNLPGGRYRCRKKR